jgi:hypothetical protein
VFLAIFTVLCVLKVTADPPHLLFTEFWHAVFAILHASFAADVFLVDIHMYMSEVLGVRDGFRSAVVLGRKFQLPSRTYGF